MRNKKARFFVTTTAWVDGRHCWLLDAPTITLPAGSAARMKRKLRIAFARTIAKMV